MNLKTTFIALAAAVMLTFAGPATASHDGPHEGSRDYRMNFYACIDKDAVLEGANLWVNGTGIVELSDFILQKSKEKTPEGYPICTTISGYSIPLTLVGTFNRMSDNKVLYILEIAYGGFSQPLYVYSTAPLHPAETKKSEERGV